MEYGLGRSEHNFCKVSPGAPGKLRAKEKGSWVMGKGEKGGVRGVWEEAGKGVSRVTTEKVRGRVRLAGHTTSSMCVEELVGPVCLLCPVCLLKGLVAREGAAVGGDTGVTVPVGKHRVACAVKV